MAVIPAQAVVAVIGARGDMAVIPAQAAVAVFGARGDMAVIPAQAGIHGCACPRSPRRDSVPPAPRQALPGEGSHWGGLR